MTSVHFVFRQREFVGPCPHRDRDYRIASNFWKFYLNRTSFTLNWFLWWKCLDCLDWNRLFWCSGCGHSSRCTTYYLLAGPACLWCLVLESTPLCSFAILSNPLPISKMTVFFIVCVLWGMSPRRRTLGVFMPGWDPPIFICWHVPIKEGCLTVWRFLCLVFSWGLGTPSGSCSQVPSLRRTQSYRNLSYNIQVLYLKE